MKIKFINTKSKEIVGFKAKLISLEYAKEETNIYTFYIQSMYGEDIIKIATDGVLKIKFNDGFIYGSINNWDKINEGLWKLQFFESKKP